ncbi:MAG: phosphotransferase, partial [Acidobacteriota bacterium]|nr:phosphotransferase [Acidobacteriota bacterium]
DRALPFEETDHLARLDDPQLARAGRERFREARARAEEAIAALRGAVPMQLLHGDFHPWNVKVQRSRIAAFDFEDLMWGWPIQDVATALYYFHGNPEYQVLANAFAEGYRSVAPWPAANQSEIDTFLMGRALVLANYVLASAELRDRSAYWFRRFDRRISALLEGADYVPLPDSQV